MQKKCGMQVLFEWKERNKKMTMRERIAAGNPCKVIREINEHDMKYYYRDREILQEDLDEERALR